MNDQTIGNRYLVKTDKATGKHIYHGCTVVEKRNQAEIMSKAFVKKVSQSIFFFLKEIIKTINKERRIKKGPANAMML